MYKLSYLMVLAGLVLQTACSQQSDVATDSSRVLVKVNGESITELQLVANIGMLFGDKQKIESLTATEQHKILQSMVMSRLIRQQAETEMSMQERQVFEQKAVRYKEKIMVNSFLKKNVSVEPVSNEMVADYYSKNLDKYGADKVVTYEVLTTDNKLSEIERDRFLAVYSGLKKTDNILVLKKTLSSKASALTYSKRSVKLSLLDTKIKSMLSGLKENEVSTVLMQKGRPYIVKLIERKENSAQPLSAVAGEIRKSLAPVALKRAIKKKTDKLKVSAKIEYFK